MRLLQPFFIRADHTPTNLRLVNRIFQFKSVPFGNSFGNRICIGIGLQQIQHTATQMIKPEMWQ